MATLPRTFRTAALAQRLAHDFDRADQELYLVGGAVRDALLHIESDEADFATSARPEKTFELLKAFPGARPYRVGEKFGTIGSHIDEFTVEITTYRVGERYVAESRKPAVTFGRSLFDDLERRDFTINAIAAELKGFTIIDPLGGLGDLKLKVVRSVGDPTRRFQEDPLRLLRAVRFAARLGFHIDPQTWSSMTRLAPALHTISRERVRDEYSRMLTAIEPSRALTLMRNSGLLEQSVPQLMELTRMPDHGPRHPLSLWDHEMRVLDGVPPRLELRWAALLHDVAKPTTRTHEADGRPRFFHHEEVGADIAREILTDLRYSGSFVDAVAVLVSSHMQLHAYSDDWSDGAVRRLMLRLGSCLDDAIALVEADARGHSLTGESANAPKFAALRSRIERLNSVPVHIARSPLSGDDLMRRYRRDPGPWIREVKRILRDEVLEGRIEPEDREAAWAVADRVVQTDLGG